MCLSDIMIRQSGIALIVAVGAAFALAIRAQESGESYPAPSNVRGAQYPRIDKDRRVTFRVKAPESKSVSVAGRAADSGMNVNKPYR